MRNLIICTMLFAAANITYGQDFDGLNFGDSKDKIIQFHQDVEWDSVSDETNEIDTITYYGIVENKDVLVEFVLIHDQLVAGTYEFGNDSSVELHAKFDDIYPIFKKKYGEPDNLHKKKHFQKAIWVIGGATPYFIELDGGHGLVKVHFDWYERIEKYQKEAKKANNSKKKRI